MQCSAACDKLPPAFAKYFGLNKGSMMSELEVAWAAQERALSDRIRSGGFAIALSGGGHRATLATLGALIAIVDRGLSPKVIQVASVSGGSITNAFIAQRCQFERLGPGELDGIATELATTIIRKGVLTRGWMALLLLAPVVFGVVAATVFRAFVVPWTWLAVAIGLGVALVLLIARGLAVEWLLDRRYFRRRTAADRRGHRARLASLSGGDVDHVFCMTDLALGLPVYASSQNGGTMWRRLKLERSGFGGPPFQTFDAGKLSIAELVRASAAFPGIPPRRLRIPPDSDVEIVSDLPRVALLADGGLWNNLGTHAMREDLFIGSHAAKDNNGVPRPYWLAPADIPLLCFNGSAPLRSSHPWMFSVPGVALLQALLQTANILNANTVLPRVEAMQTAFDRRVQRSTSPDKSDPVNLVVDLTGTEDTYRRYTYGFLSESSIRSSDPSVKKGETDLLIIVKYGSDPAKRREAAEKLYYASGKQSETQGSYPIVGLANLDDWKTLRDSPAWRHLVERDGGGRVDAPTTLDCIDVNLARRLIARGYLNTYLVSLFLAPLSSGEHDRLANVESRLDQIVGIRGTSKTE
jgi:predicted acylesterase/phospholipase RssA